jgi:hypothetical protein
MKRAKGRKIGIEHKTSSRRKPNPALNDIELSDEEELGLSLANNDDELGPESSLEEEALLDISGASESDGSGEIDSEEEEENTRIGRRK